ncbi:hypothetical protein ABMA28_017129 [Loxostege sticticalis]|uniref:Uncharacterized protein n=1 Tax=Loxostege sticticalis TaxID=481309 RepID=A0ABD0TAW8_LOXSC
MVLEGEQVEKPSAAEETCLRGFSFMPETKVEMNLQFIEGEELERTWRTTRRQRAKEREQKIWDEFVKEQDVLSSVCKDDPYQFLEQLPEDCLKELLEIELQKMKKETEEEEKRQVQAVQEQQGGGDSPRQVPIVTFADDDTGDDSDLIHIYDDEKDDEQSGPEDEALNDSLNSPCTVRDNYPEVKGLSPTSPPHSPDKGSYKSPESVTNMIESSIYCAKVRDLRIKINEELGDIVNTLECRDIQSIDPEDLVKMRRRSTEFCARFNRIYMYQLHRQIHDVKRNNKAALPFARHTQFQAQMVRIVSLHQNLLQALQIFHKSFEQTACVSESADMLRCALHVAREACAAARAVPPPRHLHAARDLYDDEVLPSCDKLEEAIKVYAAKMSSYIASTNNTNTSRSKRSSRSSKKRSKDTWSKSGSNKIKSDAESRLSMYSLDTLRINLHPKSSSSRDNQSGGTSKVRVGVSSRGGAQEANQPPQRTPRKSPRSSRRPLMRDPQGVRRRARDAGADIRTMVEAVEACTSSHISREPSPPASLRHRSRNTTPRPTKVKESPPRRSLGASPHKLRSISPKKLRRASPARPQTIRAALSSIRTNPLGTAESSQVQMNPVSKIQCAKRGASPKAKATETSPRDNSPRHDRRDTPRHENTPRSEQREGSPRYDNRGTSPRLSPRDSARRESPRSPRSVREIERAEWDRNKVRDSL